MSSDPMSAFVTQLQSRDWKARKTAVEALGRLGDPRAVENLLSLANDVRWEVQSAVAEALGLIGDLRALTTLYEMFDGVTYGRIESDGAPHRFDAIVGGAAVALAQLYRQHQDPAIWEKLDNGFHRNLAVRVDGVSLACVIRGLPYTGDRRVTPYLLQAASMSDAWIRFRAFEALGILRDPEGLPALYQAVETGEPLTIVKAAADAIAVFGVPEADHPLMKGFQRLETYKVDSYFVNVWYQVRVRVSRALGLIATPEAVRFLHGRLADSTLDAKTIAAIGLGYAGERQVVPVLIAGLKKGHVATQVGAVEVLSALRSPEAILPLQQRLVSHDATPELGEAIRQALQASEGWID